MLSQANVANRPNRKKNEIKHIIRRLALDAFSVTLIIGVSACIALQPQDDQMLNLSQNVFVGLGLLLFGALLSEVLVRLQVPTLGEKLFEPSHKKIQRESVVWYRTFSFWQLFAAFFAAVVAGTLVTKFSLYGLLDVDGFAGARRIFSGLSSPNFEILPEAVRAIITTIFIAFMSTVLAIPVAFVLSFFAARNLMKGKAYFFYLLLRTSLNVTRSVEPLIWAIIFSVWVGIGPFAGMLALFVQSLASLTKQYSEIIESVNEGPIEGIESTGATQLQVIWYAIVPQVILPFISFTVYRWDINVRMATIIGMVGGGGIGTMLMNYQGQAMYRELGCIIVVIATVVWILDQTSAAIREALK